jgi:DNA repair ATPase RecN
LRENSLELENAKSLLSEKEVIIKNLEEELARCQSELDAREKKLNDVEVRNFETQNINHFSRTCRRTAYHDINLLMFSR